MYEVIGIGEVIEKYFLPGIYGSIGSLLIILIVWWGFVKIISGFLSLIRG